MQSNQCRHPNRKEPLVITAGFPCQDASLANTKGAGTKGKKTALFREAIRIARKMGSEYLVLENVPGLFIRGFEDILQELSETGFSVWWRTISAQALGYPFRGERVFIVAFSPAIGVGLEKMELFDEIFEEIYNKPERAKKRSNTCRKISQYIQPENYNRLQSFDARLPEWLVKQRFRAIGNAVQPDMAEIILLTILNFHHQIITPKTQ
ncbi:MAG: hypothetical protein D6765_17610 [Bacteroidetes bacterium]|nr:MAG: hypothetical protein D6765_17610 [Bacteroidota bacterium]